MDTLIIIMIPVAMDIITIMIPITMDFSSDTLDARRQ